MKKFGKDEILNPLENIRVEKKSLHTGRKEEIHTHDFVEIIYAMEGRALQHVDDVEYTARKGSVIMVNYNQTHAFEAIEDFTYVDILLEPQFVSEELMNTENIFEIFSIALFKEFSSTTEENMKGVCFEGENLFETESIVKNMLREFNEKNTGYISILSGYIRVLFSKFLREIKKSPVDNAKYTAKINADIIEFIDAHCYEKISLSQLASKCFYNPSYFSYAFKKHCGKNLRDYIKEKRVLYAVELLETTDYSVAKIGELVGYIDKTSFYKAFRDLMGKTPSAYRNELKINN